MWLEQIIATADREGSFYHGKRFAAQYFYRYELPKTGPQLDLLDSLDRTTVDISVDGFGAWVTRSRGRSPACANHSLLTSRFPAYRGASQCLK